MSRFLILLLICSMLLSNQFNAIQSQSSDIVRAIAWRDDGTQYALGYVSGVIHIMDAETGELVAELRDHSSYIVALAWSSNGDMVVSSAFGDNVRVWSVEEEKVIQEIIVEDAGPAIYALAWSPDDSKILGGASEVLTLQIWDVETGERLEAFSHLGAVGRINFSPDGREIALANILEIKILDAETLEILQVLRPSGIQQGQDFSAIVWSTSSNQLASGSLNGNIRLWDTESGEMIWEVLTDNEESTFIYDLAFNSDSERLFALNRKGIIQVYETSTSKLLLSLNVGVETSLQRGQISPTMGNLSYSEEGGDLVIVEISQLVTDRMRLRIVECTSNDSIKTTLLNNLEDNQIENFITYVEAQRGNQIDERCADELRGLAETLQNTLLPHEK